MIGYEDEPDRSAEICICEIFGRDMAADRAGVGMGLHPFGDPRIRDEFTVEDLAIDARDFHVYAAEWTPGYVAFFVDHQLVKLVEQSPGYPMQFMLDIYEFPEDQPPQPADRVSRSSSSSTTSAATGPHRRTAGERDQGGPARSPPASGGELERWVAVGYEHPGIADHPVVPAEDALHEAEHPSG